MQVCTAAAAAAAAAADVVNNDAKDSEMQSLNADVTEPTDSRPLTADNRSTPAAGDEPGNAPASSSVGSEQTLQPFGSK